jgi:hypothetical protein
MKSLWVLVPLVIVSSGCITPSLERHALSQIKTSADFRYQATLHCLAMVAADPGSLPSYALLSNGAAMVQDTGVANAATTWALAPKALFKSEVLGFTAAHAPQAQWTVDPVTDYTQLEALRAACQWVLEGQDLSVLPSISILADPVCSRWATATTDPAGQTPPPHFGVDRRLQRLPQQWLGRGRAGDVPKDACYSEECGQVAVWVMPEGLTGLAEFTLVLQDIATLDAAPADGSRPANITPPLLMTLWEVQNTLPAVNVVIYRDPGSNKVVFRQEGCQEGVINVNLGQSVVWWNWDGIWDHTIKIPPLNGNREYPLCKILARDNDKQPSASEAIPFDEEMFKRLGGTPKIVEIRADILDTAHNRLDQIQNVSFTVTLTRIAPADPMYSATLVFRDDRVIKPDSAEAIEGAIRAGLTSCENDNVSVARDDWINKYTTRYQGQRAGVKPGAATQKAVVQRPKLTPPSLTTRVNQWGVRKGLIFQGGTPMSPIKPPPMP